MTLGLVPPRPQPGRRPSADIAKLSGAVSLRAHHGEVDGLVLAVRTAAGWELSCIGLTSDEQRGADTLVEALHGGGDLSA